MRKSTKGWLKAAVITFGVVDCVGIYVAQNRLAQPVPTDMGNDLAYALPAETGLFRPDQGMPALSRPAAPASAAPAPVAKTEPVPVRLAVAAPAKADAAPAGPQFAVVAPAIAPVHRAAAAPMPGTVKLARIEPAAPPRAAAKHGATAGRPTDMSGLVSQRTYTRLFADAFSGMTSVPLDAPITVQLDDASTRGLAEDDSADEARLAYNDEAPPAALDSGSAASLPEAGPAAILPDSDVL